MKNLLITQTSLGGFVGPQAVAEFLVPRGRVAGCVCGPGAPCQMEQALTPVDRAPAPHKKSQASGPGLKLVASAANGEWTPDKLDSGFRTAELSLASTNKLAVSITFFFLSLSFPTYQRA